MEKLKLKPNVKAEEARKHPSLGLVYLCPKCNVGASLTHFSSETIECKRCGGKFKKP